MTSLGQRKTMDLLTQLGGAPAPLNSYVLSK